MFIQTEETPNPNTLKFFPGADVCPDKTVFITNFEEAQKYQLASILFEIQDIKTIMLGNDFISITKEENEDWEILKPQIFSVIVDYFVSGKTIENTNEEDDDEEPSDQISKDIKKIIDEKVRPAVMQDGGNVIFKKFEDGVVYLKLQGACSGCPSAEITLKDGIENMLQYYFSEVQKVEQVYE